MKDNPAAFNADSYDEKIRQTLPYYDEFYKQIVDIVRIYKSTPLTWLDVGCGTGKMAEVAFGKINMNQFVFCDCSEQMLQTAKIRFSGKNTIFRLSSVQELEYIEVFDVITAFQVHHYLQKEARQQAIRNCYQALKAGGLFITFENVAPFGRLGEELYLERWKSYQVMQGKSQIECEQHIRRYNKEYFPITITEH